jgi:FolB domain-containing protein
MDVIFVRNISIHALIGEDCWARKKPQPAVVSVKVYTDISKAGATDQIHDTLDYRIINNAVNRHDGGTFFSIGELTQTVAVTVKEGFGSRVARCEVDVQLPKGVLQAQGGVRLQMAVNQVSALPQLGREFKRLSVEELWVSCIIGIGEHEKKEKQPVVVTLRFEDTDTVDYKRVAASVVKVRGSRKTGCHYTIDEITVH